MYKNIHNYRICLFIVSLELWNWIGIFGQINFSNSEKFWKNEMWQNYLHITIYKAITQISTIGEILKVCKAISTTREKEIHKAAKRKSCFTGGSWVLPLPFNLKVWKWLMAIKGPT